MFRCAKLCTGSRLSSTLGNRMALPPSRHPSGPVLQIRMYTSNSIDALLSLLQAHGCHSVPVISCEVSVRTERALLSLLVMRTSLSLGSTEKVLNPVNLLYIVMNMFIVYSSRGPRQNATLQNILHRDVYIHGITTEEYQELWPLEHIACQGARSCFCSIS